MKNSLVFEGNSIIRHAHSTAMGTRIAPSYANNFMGDLERRILDEVEVGLTSGGGMMMMCLPSGITTKNI